VYHVGGRRTPLALAPRFLHLTAAAVFCYFGGHRPLQLPTVAAIYIRPPQSCIVSAAADHCLASTDASTNLRRPPSCDTSAAATARLPTHVAANVRPPPSLAASVAAERRRASLHDVTNWRPPLACVTSAAADCYNLRPQRLPTDDTTALRPPPLRPPPLCTMQMSAPPRFGGRRHRARSRPSCGSRRSVTLRWLPNDAMLRPPVLPTGGRRQLVCRRRPPTATIFDRYIFRPTPSLSCGRHRCVSRWRPHNAATRNRRRHQGAAAAAVAYAVRGRPLLLCPNQRRHELAAAAVRGHVGGNNMWPPSTGTNLRTPPSCDPTAAVECSQPRLATTSQTGGRRWLV